MKKKHLLKTPHVYVKITSDALSRPSEGVSAFMMSLYPLPPPTPVFALILMPTWGLTVNIVAAVTVLRNYYHTLFS